MKHVFGTFSVSMVCVIISRIFLTTLSSTGEQTDSIDETVYMMTYNINTEEPEECCTLILDPHENSTECTTEILSEEQQVTDEDIGLIALITMGEAEGECEEGKRLVIDTILNRVDNARFPNSISEVIYQPNQFSCVWNGRLDRTAATEEVRQLVREELINRCNYNVLYFTAGNYGKYGTHLFQCGNHYFCGE